MGLFGSFLAKFPRSKASPEDIDAFRRVLIESDIGVGFTGEIVELVKREPADQLQEKVMEKILASLSTENRTIELKTGRVTTILIVGVNGTGKTTSVAKLAKRFQGDGRKVLLAAADTFRAAAVEQLSTWGKRIGIDVVTGKANGDPASVAFDAATKTYLS